MFYFLNDNIFVSDTNPVHYYIPFMTWWNTLSLPITR